MAKKQESGYKWTQHSSAAGVGIGLGTVFLLCAAFFAGNNQKNSKTQ
ncbi:hypothetical protein V7150_25425 [Neobacillus drentensis]